MAQTLPPADATRMARCLHATRGRGLSVYLPAGHPDKDSSLDFFDAVVRGGADWVELGIPFSDPAADGPAIQVATARAVRQGYRVQDALALARALRKMHPHVPIIAMTYANIAHRRGWGTFAADLQDAGIDGLILPDVPLEESEAVRKALAQHDVAWIPLVSPTTPADRMKAIADTCTGFLYVVGNVGITGQADPGRLIEATVERARQATDKPLAVGFGIATPADVARVLTSADAAIVGSHVVRLIEEGATPRDIEQAVAQLRRGAVGEGAGRA